MVDHAGLKVPADDPTHLGAGAAVVLGRDRTELRELLGRHPQAQGANRFVAFICVHRLIINERARSDDAGTTQAALPNDCQALGATASETLCRLPSMPPPRMTVPTLKVLAAFLEDPTAEWHGFDLGDRTGIKSGTLYPLLARLENAGWLRSRWEDIDPRIAGRPRRRLYTLTGRGQEAARHELTAHVESLSTVNTPVPGDRRALRGPKARLA